MSSYNKVILIGNLTRDPEIRYTQSGTCIVKLGLAVNRKWRDRDGSTQEETTFVDVDTFGKTAENCGQYLSKGRAVLIEGRLKLDTWDDKQTGQKRSRLGITAETVQFIGGGNGSNSGNRADVPKTTNSDYNTPSGADPNNIPPDDDVPF